MRLLWVAAALVLALSFVDRLAMAARPDRLAALEARLAALDAKEEIRELFSRYGFTADTGDAKGWSEVWAENATYERADAVIRGLAAHPAMQSMRCPTTTGTCTRTPGAGRSSAESDSPWLLALPLKCSRRGGR